MIGNWETGDVVLDRYEIMGLLWESGWARVYRVFDRDWGIELAFKTLVSDALSIPGCLDQFLREAETRINLPLHPNILTCHFVLDLGRSPGVFHELPNGTSLSESIACRRLYSGEKREVLQRILDIAVQIAWGLQCVHDCGIVHGDIKPAHVLIDEDGVAKVFGFSGSPGSVFTPWYQSPEQGIDGSEETVGKATDFWSWGLIVLEMFKGGSTWLSGRVAKHVLNDYLDSGSGDATIPGMPESLAALLRRCFQEDPSERPGSMTEMVETLKKVYEKGAATPYPRREPEAGKDCTSRLNNKAVSMLALGQGEKARALWETALHRESGLLEAEFNYGLFRWRNGEITDRELMAKFKALAPAYDHWIPGYALAQIQMEGGDFAGALTTLDRLDEAITMSGPMGRARQAAMARLQESSQLVRTLEGHTQPVSCVRFFREGQYALSGGYDNTLRLWNTQTGVCLRTLEGHTGAITSISVDSDTLFAVSASSDGSLRLWDTVSGNSLAALTPNQGELVRFHHPRTHEAPSNLNRSPLCTSVALGDGSQLVLFAGTFQGTTHLGVWDLSTGTHTGVLWSAPFEDEILCACMTSDNRSALCGTRQGALRLWDLSSAQCLRSFVGHRSAIRSLCLSPDDRYALSGGADKALRLWDIQTGRCVRSFHGHQYGIRSVSLSHDQERAISLDGSGILMLWNARTGQCLHTFPAPAQGPSNSLCAAYAHSVDGSPEHVLVSTADSKLELWSIGRPRTYVSAPLISPIREELEHTGKQTIPSNEPSLLLSQVPVTIVAAEQTQGASTISSEDVQQTEQFSSIPVTQFVPDIEALLRKLAGDMKMSPEASELRIPGYTVHELVARGGSTQFFRGTREADNGRVCIKLLLEALRSSRASRAFLREAEVGRRMKHQNLVEIYEAGEVGGTPYLIMEYCGARSLGQLLHERKEPLSLEEAQSIMLEVLKGLAHMHERGFVHRNLSPSKILLTDPPETTAKICGFNLVRNVNAPDLDTPEEDGVVAGTPAFMPREQLVNFHYTTAVSDVWAAGGIFFYLLTGAMPRDMSKRNPLECILKNDAIPIQERNPGIPTEVAKVIDRSLATMVEDRYQDAREFLAALQSAFETLD